MSRTARPRTPPRNRRARGACLLGAGLLLLWSAAPAVAAPTATFDAGSGTLTVTGDAAAETFDVASSTGDQVVTTSAELGDPDGAGSDCAASVTGVSCKGSAVRTIVVDAGGGDDTLSGVNTLDPIASVRLNGQDGDDALTSNNVFGQFRLDGGPGDDELNAGIGRFASSPFGTGTDTATGGPGNDTFNGGDDVDNFAAEPGADIYRGGGPGPGPEGFPAFYPRYTPADTLTYDARSASVSVTLDGLPDDGAADEDDNVGADIENVAGGAGDDILQAGGSAVILSGHRGNDVIAGGPGRDLLSGGDNDDAIDAQGGGVDQVACGAGSDSAVVDFPAGQPPVGDAHADCEMLELIGGGAPAAKPVLTLTTMRMSSAGFRRTRSLRLTARCAAACAIKGDAVLKTPSLRARFGGGPVGAGALPIAPGARRLTIRSRRSTA